ncbi:MAG: hypothetical protein L6422_02700 [Candidatus Marinimicrobia bacterium]|nr:hypothetical protein [Candidatus Neomarinimicrobiota bacterium]
MTNYSCPYSFTVSINSAILFLIKELYGRVNLGEGALDTAVYEANNLQIIDPNILPEDVCKNVIQSFSRREIVDVNTEYGLPNCSYGNTPNPLSDRKALDNIIFNTIGLTQDERNEVYCAVCELVQQRLAKAGSLR